MISQEGKLLATKDLLDIKYHIYKPNNSLSTHFLDTLLSKKLYHNNTSYKLINLHKLEKNGIIVIPIKNNTPIGMIGALIEEENGIRFAKYGYRLAMSSNHFFNISKETDKIIDNWLYKNQIYHYTIAINDYNFRLIKMIRRHHFKKLKNLHCLTSPEVFYTKNIKLHNKMVYEKYTWSYMFYSSPDKQFFLDRKEKKFEKDELLDLIF